MKTVAIFLMGIMLSMPLAYAEIPLLKLEQDHIRVFYDSQVTKDFAQTVLQQALEQRSRIMQSLGVSRMQLDATAFDITIKIYRQEEDYFRDGGSLSWSHGSALLKQRLIQTFPQAHGFFDSTLPHEMTHIIFRQYVGLDVAVPLWFEEGLAMYHELAKRFGADDVVRDSMKKGEFITLTDLTHMRLYNDTSKAVVMQFYQESASVFNFLMSEFGDQKLQVLLRYLRDKNDFELALSKTYMKIKSLDDIQKWWVLYLKGDV